MDMYQKRKQRQEKNNSNNEEKASGSNINWYPGHMAKAKRQMQEDLKLVDVIIEILDARIPYSSKNPDIEKMSNGKQRIILLNKADMADENVTKEWKSFYEKQGYFVGIVNSKAGTGVKNTVDIINKACEAKLERDRKKGILARPLRAMIAGIPNSGKSTFINSLSGKSCTKTGNKPGVTTGKQWIRLNKQVELLDTPGILWPKFEDNNVGLNIAFIGSINDQILFPEELAYELIKKLCVLYPGCLTERYGIEEDSDANQCIDAIAIRRGCLKKGAEPDREKASKIILEDFREVKLGRITLERVLSQNV